MIELTVIFIFTIAYLDGCLDTISLWANKGN